MDTMSPLLTKRISSSHQHLCLLLPRLLRLSLSTQTEHPKDIPFIAQYLISSFDFSMDRALKLSSSSRLSLIRTPNQPDSVIQFFKKTGLSDAQIKNLITFQPILLSSSVDKTFEPRARELISAGFAGETLVQLIRLNPLALNSKNTLPRLQYWRQFVGNCDESLLKVIRRNGLLICHDIYTSIVPKINLLKEYGLSQEDITKVFIRGPRFMLQKLESLKQALERTEELGFPLGSGMFIKALIIVGSMKKEAWDKKIEFYKKTFGWSEEEIISAFKKFPTLLGLSNKTVETKMNFLVKKANFKPKSVASEPALLVRSLEKRLVPRHHVLSILREKGVSINCSLSTVCWSSEKSFVEKFVLPYKEMVPELAKAYHSAYAGGKVVL